MQVTFTEKPAKTSLSRSDFETRKKSALHVDQTTGGREE